jgi:CheY-like chemotaxis protein
MPLILAIEPDKRQAAHITSMARHRLHAELVLAVSADRALAALGDRIPDLILTPALLPPQDEAALAERLRQLDERAAHVQTLTIPLLAAPGRSSPARGMLAALRRERPGSSGDGCDPAVFAEQVTAYLERAAIERQEHHRAHGDERVPVDAQSVLHAEPMGAGDAMAAFEPEPAFQPEAASEPEPAHAEPVHVEPVAPAFAASTFVEPAPIHRDELPTIVDEPAAEIFASSSVGLPTLEAMAADEPPEFEIVAIADEPEEPAEEDETVDEIDLAPFLAEGRSRNVDPADAAAAIMAAVAAAERLTTSAPEQPAASADTWTPRRFGAQPAWPALEGVEAEAGAAPGAAVANAAAEPTPLKKRRSKKNPLQDEWGFFDPAQCGFAALLAKLEEITEKDDIRSA